MKLDPPHKRKALSMVRPLLVVVGITLVPLLLYGSAPSWWPHRGVVSEGATPDDYAPVNQGQLKNIAKAAVAEMEDKLPGGAGETLHRLIASWSVPTSQTNDFAPVNLGQLKNVAKPFYDRLIAAGAVDFYPWLTSVSLEDDFAVADIGQVKNLFGFRITTANTLDDPLTDRVAASQRAGNLALEAQAVWFWGNRFGGDYSFEKTYPKRLSGLPALRSISSGDDYLVVLGTDGTVLSWGKNNLGQLGDGTNVDRAVAALIPNLVNIISVKAGGAHTLALQQDGTILAWGDNYYGQLGTGDNTPSSSPIQVAGLTGVRKIAAGPQRSVALKEDGTVWTWGYDHYNSQTGGDVFNSTPAQINNFNDVIDIAAGYEHVVAVKADGTVWAWGSNYSNQIGNGNQWWQFQDVPARVPNLANVVKVAAGLDHTLALLADGTVWAWGVNNFGQLGDGTIQPRQSPVQVVGLTNVIAIAAAWPYSLAMKSDGTVWTWGEGSSGTLPNADLHVPQQVGLGLYDTDHDGMDDRWETEYFGSLNESADGDADGDGISNRQEFFRGTDPRDYFNGASAVVEIVSGNNQLGDPAMLLPKPVTVRIKNASGQLLVNAPVHFRVTTGGASLVLRPGDTLEDNLVVRSDRVGEASAYVMLPAAPGVSSHIAATPATPDSSVFTGGVTFRMSSRFILPSTPTPSPDPNATPAPSATPTSSPTAMPRPPYRYAIIDLGKDVYPLRINNKAEILITAPDAQVNWSYYRWKGGVMERLTYSDPNAGFRASDINDDSVVVGSIDETPTDFASGIVWQNNTSSGQKVSGNLVSEGLENNPRQIRRASFSAVTNAGHIYGETATGGRFLGIEIGVQIHSGLIQNSARWSTDGSLLKIISTGAPILVVNGHDNWTGRLDTITRANAAGAYIGRSVVASNNLVPFPSLNVNVCTSTDMVSGEPVSFGPIDINEAGIVAGSAGADMVVSSSPNSQTTISGASPLAINDHTRPAPSPQSSPAPSPLPTPIPAPQILAWAGNALVIWELQDDSHIWHPFGLEEMIPSMDGWESLEPYDMNDAGAIVGRAWYTDPSIPGAQGEYHAFLLVPVELMVDGNRDGEMSFTDLAVHEADQTSEERPYRFWVNDDDDGAAGDTGDHVPAANPDYADGVIRSVRDLEDFARLHVNLAGFEAGLESGSIKAAFEWHQVSNSPRIKVYRAASSGTDYLTNESKASAMMLFPFRDTLGEVVPQSPLFIPQDFWASRSFISNVPKTLPIGWFLFEGSGEGEGQLVVSFWKDGRKIGETAGACLDLKNVKKVYQHQVLSGEDPWNGVRFEPASDEQHDVVVFVHGWRLSPSDAANFAETMFKRLWWQGFKGRFAAVRWDTYYNRTDHGWVPYAGQAIDAYLSKFNDSEHNAWLTGPALKAFVNSLPFDYKKHIVAHSMGNVVTGSALEQGLIVNDYALLNAAVPAACYDESDGLKQVPATVAVAGLPVHLWGQPTPDDDPDVATKALAYRGRLSHPRGNLVNFYLPDDYATSFAWELNNVLTKPPGGSLAGPFLYKRDFPSGHKLIKGIENPDTEDVAVDYYIMDANEAEAYACRTWGKAVGAEGRTAGSLSESIDLSSDIFSPHGTGGFAKEHSAEFSYDIQRLQSFYAELLIQLDIKNNP